MTPRSRKPATQKHDPRGPSPNHARVTSQQRLSERSLNATVSDARIVTHRPRSGVWRRIGYSSTTSIPLHAAESTRHRTFVCFVNITTDTVSRNGTGIGRAIHSRRPVHDPRLGQKRECTWRQRSLRFSKWLEMSLAAFGEMQSLLTRVTCTTGTHIAESFRPDKAFPRTLRGADTRSGVSKAERVLVLGWFPDVISPDVAAVGVLYDLPVG